MNKPLHGLATEEPARFSVAEFEQLYEAFDTLDAPGRIELVDGVITRMPPPYDLHSFWQMRVVAKLLTALAGTHLDVRVEAGLKIGDDTLRVPDVMVVPEREPSRTYRTPAELALAVEVSDSTLALDLGPRKLRFARAGIPLYWVVDVEGERVHLFSEPRDGDYSVVTEQGFGDPLPVPGTDRTVTLA